MNCPHDGTVLWVARRSGIEIDVCPHCRGVWLDRGELDKIIAHADDPTAPHRPPAAALTATLPDKTHPDTPARRSRNPARELAGRPVRRHPTTGTRTLNLIDSFANIPDHNTASHTSERTPAMSTLKRLFDLAGTAVDKATTESTAAAPAASATDWKTRIRGAAEALTGTPPPPAAPARGWAPPPPTASGTPTPPASSSSARPPVGLTPPPAGASDPDRAAVARYEYLLRTAEPTQLEQIHRDAFARLTPTQRDQLHARMAQELPPQERPSSPSADDLARTATRAEAARPGMLAGLLARTRPSAGAVAAGTGIGVAGGLLGAVAGGAVLSAVAAPMLAEAITLGVDFDALAGSIDLQGVASDLTAGASDLVGGASDVTGGATDLVSGWGEDITGFGEQLSSLELPGWGSLFGR